MTDYTELKRLAEACGDLNWRAIQENWCEWAIRDDHAYIATMRTKSAKHAGPCPDREAKAKFLCAVTPAAVLALLDDLDEARNSMKYACVMRLKKEIDRLRGDIEAIGLSRAKLAGELSRLRAKHNDYSTTPTTEQGEQP